MISRKPALGFIFITVSLDILGIGLIIPILPRLVEGFEHGDAAAASHTVGLLTALYALMQFLCAPLLGSLSDRFGRRPVILASLLGSGLDYFLLAFAPNLGWFFVGRIIAGVTGANFGAATAYIADISPPEKRAANFGIIGAAFGVGFIAGPALGGLLGDVGLRVPFLVAGGLTLLNWLYGLLVLPESMALGNRRGFSWTRSNPVGSLLDLRRHPMAFGLTGTYFLMNLAHQVLPSTWVLYTSYRYHWTVGQTGLSLALVGLTAAIVQGGLTRVVVPRFGEKKAATFGLAIAIAGCHPQKATGTAWPAASTTADDGGESIEPRAAVTASVEKADEVDDVTAVPEIVAKPGAAAAEPDKVPTVTAPTQPTDDVIMSEEIIIEIDD